MPDRNRIASFWLRAVRRLTGLTKFIFKVAILLLVLVIVFHERLINDIYKNAEDLNDGEMPTTVTSYPSGPEVVSIIGGSGDGLNCSPSLVDLLFDGSQDQNNNRHLIRQRFRQASVFHDLCYRHGLATYGYTQNDCDRILQNQAFRLYTLPKRDVCNSTAGSQLAMVEAEMFSPSPLPMVLPDANPPNHILATALTPQRDVDHSLCLWSEGLRAQGEHFGNDNSVCTRLRETRIDGGNGLGAFQNFPVIRPGQQFFSLATLRCRQVTQRCAAGR
jgi:hypothetical protein